MPKTIQEASEIISQVSHYPPRKADCTAYNGGEILDKFLVSGDKPGGVEPGALVVLLDDVYELIENSKNLNAHPDLVARYKNLTADELAEKLSENPKDAEAIAADIHSRFENFSNEAHPPTVYLIKQDYPDARKVAPPKERLAKTNAITSKPQKIQGAAVNIYSLVRRSERADENINALLEVVGNTVAQYYGMPAQEQWALNGQYEDGEPKIMTISRWEYNLLPIKGCIAGSKDKGHYQNYLVQVERNADRKPIKNNDQLIYTKNANGRLCSESGFKRLGAEFATALLMGDRDYFGSKVQNKIGTMIEDEMHMYGFDFGHAFRENPYIMAMNNSFQFNDLDKCSKSFKNITIFMDTPMSEKMLGVLYIYKGLSDDKRDKLFTQDEQVKINEVIKAYKDLHSGAADRLDSIQPDVIGRAFQEQIRFCEEKMNDNSLDQRVRDAYKGYRGQLGKAMRVANQNEAIMMRKFSKKIQLQPAEVDFLENLNMLTAPKITKFSSDGQVALNHFTYHKDNKLQLNWKVNFDGNDEKVALEVDCSSQSFAKKTSGMLNTMLKLEGCRSDVNIYRTGGKVKVVMPKDVYNQLVQNFNETKISEYRRAYTDDKQANKALSERRVESVEQENNDSFKRP